MSLLKKMIKRPRQETQAECQKESAYSPRVKQAVEEIKASPFRQNILDFGQKMCSRIGFTVTPDDPEYWGFYRVMTDDMCEVGMAMEIRKPVTLPQLSKKMGWEPAKLKPVLDDMARIGIIEYNRENPRRELQYVLPILVPGNAEFLNMNYKQMEKYPELAQLFDHMSFLALERITPMVPMGGAGIGMHVIPVEKAIDTENQSIDIEHISYWLDKYDGKYAATPCSCRYARNIQGEGCADDPEDWCIAVGDMADYCVDNQKGRYITKEEALEIFKKAEDNGFVHQITNIDGKNKIFAICNCNVNVCFALRTSQLFNTPNLSRSAYVARVDTEKCVACGGCADHCPAGAVKLGRKLCMADGEEPVYPVQELPDEVEWGPEKWDEDYRNTIRTEIWPTGTAPCKTACPAHISVQGYLKKAAEGKFTEALEVIKRHNPLPAVCGRICNRPCEDVCTRAQVDQALAIDEVKKFVSQQDLNPETRYIPEKVQPRAVDIPFDQKIAVIGAGPAGLSCAFFLAKKGYKPTIFERNEKPGGMLQYGVPAFKLEKDVVAAEIDIIRQMGVEIKCGVEVGKDITIQQLRDQGYKGFYIAIGCQGSRGAGVPGEDLENVYSAVEFLKGTGDDRRPYTGKNMVVIGGGNVAIDCSRTARRLGAEHVELFSLESAEEMPASDLEVDEAREENVVINNGWGLKEIKGEGGKVTSVVLKRCTSVFDADHRFNPQYDEDDTREVKADSVCLSIGQTAAWGKLLEGENVELGRGNFVKVDPKTYQTSQPDIFAGGDIFTGPKFAIDAIAHGRVAAESLHRYVQPNSSMTIGRHPLAYKELDKEDILLESYDTASRQVPKNVRNGKLEFKEYVEPLTEEQVLIETKRCLSCGAAHVDVNRCIGCGICTTKCEFDAIHLHRENPKASRMTKTENKLFKVLPYMISRKKKIKKAQKRREREQEN